MSMVSSGAHMFVVSRGVGSRLAVNNFEDFHTGSFDSAIHLRDLKSRIGNLRWLSWVHGDIIWHGAGATSTGLK